MNDSVVKTSARITYFFGAALFTASFTYVSTSKKHYLTLTSTLIYLFEITSQVADGLKSYYPKGSQSQLICHGLGFTTHWLSLALFTASYVSVATQTPLLQSN